MRRRRAAIGSLVVGELLTRFWKASTPLMVVVVGLNLIEGGAVEVEVEVGEVIFCFETLAEKGERPHLGVVFLHLVHPLVWRDSMVPIDRGF